MSDSRVCTAPALLALSEFSLPLRGYTALRGTARHYLCRLLSHLTIKSRAKGHR